MRLVENWKTAWRWFSMWLIASNATFIVAYEQFDIVKSFIPDAWAHRIIVTLLVLTGLGRVIKQSQA